MRRLINKLERIDQQVPELQLVIRTESTLLLINFYSFRITSLKGLGYIGGKPLQMAEPVLVQETNHFGPTDQISELDSKVKGEGWNGRKSQIN